MKTDNEGENEEIEVPGPAPVTVTEDDAIGDDDEGGQEGKGEFQAKLNQPPRDKIGQWTRKKNERAARHQANEKLKSDHQGALQKIAALEAEREAWRQQQQAPRQQEPAQRQQQQAPDPIARELAEIDASLEAELALLEKDPTRSPKRYNELKRRETALVVRQENASIQRQQTPQRQQQNEDPRAGEYQARWVVLGSEFPWLTEQTPQAAAMRSEVKAYRDYLIEGKKRGDTIVTDREAITHVAAQNGINVRRTAPNPGRSPFAGPSSQRAGGGNGASGQRSVAIPPQLIGGSGLSKQQLAQAVLSDDE